MARSIALRCPVTGRGVRWFSSSDKVSLSPGQRGTSGAWAADCPTCGQMHLVNVETASLPAGKRAPAPAGFVQGARQ